RRRHRVDDGVIAGAAAVVAGEVLADLLPRRRGVLSEKLRSGEQHAGRAVAALGGVAGDEGLLQLADLACVGHALDGLHLGAVQRRRQHQAAAHNRPVDAHRAGPAEAVLAAGVRAHQPQIEAQEIYQVAARLDAARDALAVDRQSDVEMGAHAARASSMPAIRFKARASSTPARCRLVCGLPCWSAGGSRSVASAAWAAAMVPASTCWPLMAAIAACASTGRSPSPKKTICGSTSVAPASRALAAMPAMA